MTWSTSFSGAKWSGPPFRHSLSQQYLDDPPMVTGAQHVLAPRAPASCGKTLHPRVCSANSRTDRAGAYLTAWAMATARAMSRGETPSCFACEQWYLKHGSQLAAMAAPMATSSATAGEYTLTGSVATSPATDASSSRLGYAPWLTILPSARNLRAGRYRRRMSGANQRVSHSRSATFSATVRARASMSARGISSIPKRRLSKS